MTALLKEPSLKESVVSICEYMVLNFNGKRYHDLEATYQYVFTDIGKGYPLFIRFSQGTASFQEGYSNNPSITITASAQTWLDIAGGHKNPLWAVITKQVTVEGKFSYFRLLPRLLTQTIEVPHSRTFSKSWTVPQKILVLIGNPRKKKGLTWYYLQHLLEGIRNSGIRPEVIHLYDKNIKQCLGCFHCWTKTPGVCVHKDDQAELLTKMDTADMIIYALPLYYHTVPGLVKTHLDRQITRMHPYVERAGKLTRHPRRVSRKQSLMLFSIAGFPEIVQFSSLVDFFRSYAEHDNVHFLEPILIPGAMEIFNNPTHRSVIREKTDRLRSAGEQICRTGHIRRKTIKTISSVPTAGNKWRHGANMHWIRQMGTVPSPEIIERGEEIMTG